jgi:hypothetical protein
MDISAAMQKATRRRTLRSAAAFVFAMSATALSIDEASALPLVRQASGATPAEIQDTIDAFRSDLGGSNNGSGGAYLDGRREVNWDGVPDNLASPNAFPAKFYNTTSPRGLVLNAVLEDAGSNFNAFAVSADSANATLTPVRFADINPQYSSNFQTYSSQRLFTAPGTRVIEVTFYVPGTTEPAVVSGFGAVFADVDQQSGGGRTRLKFVDAEGTVLLGASAPAENNGLSFVGATFPDGQKVARVYIIAGTDGLAASKNDGVGGVDLVAMDDFIYGEPLSMFRILEDGFEAP